ncbi:methyltransferase, FxLD system [Streptomyces sp. RK23]|uniref:methyltransferase, FxLD system n=1 Tax=unclassified Streptomyces TaxID=2593676 RepID=UPI001B36C68A|nr:MULTISPECIES: methyltransferase, FxLD system [unclassified Streptomyces]MBQ0967509.1 methyltransferase, FxLD system [Streptomyces sp. RK74B]MBQ1008045.1 methyltransferase, FxLD system [Streptomyces sp. RK23]
MSQTPTAARLRNRLVDAILSERAVPSDVERAMRTVPRDAFLPGIELENAYTDQAVTIKDNPGKPLPLSCASVPSIVAMMLDQLGARPGNKVLEVGAGTGYNAALLAELVGGGKVTTVDIDSDVALHARTTLNAAGYDSVTVIERNGLLGAHENAPYDRIIATVGVWDIPATWWGQLVDGGRLVLPLRWRGQTQSVVLTRRGNELVSDGMELCGFVPIIGQTGEKTASLNAADTIRLHYDQDQAVDTDALADTLLANKPAGHFLSAQRIGGEETFDGVWLRATADDDRVCRLEVTLEAVEQDLIPRPAVPGRSPVLVTDDSLAYLTVTREGIDPERPFRLGAAAYGPRGEELAHDLIAHIDAWGAARRVVPRMTVTPSATAAAPGHVISKPESRITLAY